MHGPESAPAGLAALSDPALNRPQLPQSREARPTRERGFAAKAMAKDLTHFIGGKHVKGTSGRYLDVTNPNTGEVTARTPLASSRKLLVMT